MQSLIYSTLVAAPYLVAVLLGLFLPLAAVLAYRYFGFGAALLGVTFFVGAALPEVARGGLHLGIALYPADIVTVLLLAVLALRLANFPELRPRNPGLWVLTAVLVINTLHGLATLGAAGGNGARAEVYSFTAAFYAVSFRFDSTRLRTLLRVLIGVAFALVLLSLYRWVITALDVRELLPPSGSCQPAGHSKWRVIVSNEALVLAELGVLCWYFAGRSQPLQGWQLLAPLLLAMVGLLQHRSTWVAALLAMLAATVAGRAKGAGRSLWLVGVMSVLLAGVLAVGGGNVAGDVSHSAKDAVQLRGTAAARLGSWQELLKGWAGGGPRVLAIGHPTGTVLERYAGEELGARKITYQAHNYYVTVITYHGAVGFAAFLAMLGLLITQLYRATALPDQRDTASILLALMVAQCGYYLTYGTDFLQWLVTGVALAFVHSLRPADQASRQPYRHPATLPRSQPAQTRGLTP